jgi:hypothetical protein
MGASKVTRGARTMAEHDYEAELRQQLQPPSSRGFFTVVGVVAAVLVLGVLGVTFKRDLKRLTEPAAADYVAAEHEAGYRTWMSDAFPNYVVAVGRGDEERRTKAGLALIEASRFHDAFAWHNEMLVDALEDYIAWSEDTLIQDVADAREALSETSQALDALEDMLRDTGAPFSVDARIAAYKEGPKWRLNFIARTSEVLSTSRFKAGDDEVEVLRVRRLDGLALRDLAHGKAKNGRAFVLEDGPRRQVNSRLLTGLGDLPELRDLGQETQSVLNGSEIAVALEALLPEEIRPQAHEIGELARRRRSTLEAIDRQLRRRKAKLVEPTAFFVDERFYKGMQRRFGAKDPTVEQLQNISVLSEEDPKVIAATRRAAAALVEHYTVGVEHHEAWHLLLPDPPPVDGLHPGATGELAAYVGEVADAGPELPIVWDAILRLHRLGKENPRPTATHLAIAFLVEHVKPPYGPPLTERLAYVQRRARELKKQWFNEARVLVRQP